MGVYQNKSEARVSRLRIPAVVKMFLLVILVATMFLLMRDMVRHRFFRGGRVNIHDVLKP